jgi:phosphomannomutase
VPDELNPDLAFDIGRALGIELGAQRVVVGRDVRLSGAVLCEALILGLRESEADVADMGVCGTEEVYHAVFSQGFDGGVIVTASHNPKNYNGMKFVRKNAAPISGDSGLLAVRDRIAHRNLPKGRRMGEYALADYRAAYVRHLLSYVDVSALWPLRILADPGHGCAGPVARALAEHLPFIFKYIHETPDGNFPNGVPNPLLPENRAMTMAAVRESGADMGIAWDGDFDRCFFYDAEGGFIEGYYIVGLLAQSILRGHPGAKILHDPRLVWNTVELVREAGGIPVESKTGHAFIKERMRAEDAVYGGEMSAHHYFKNFAYCDSGMIPWLLVAELMCGSGRPLAELVRERMEKFPCSGEINLKVSDPVAAVAAVRAAFGSGGVESGVDGLSLAFATWRCNLRSSNTEPLLRLNVESRGDKTLMEDKTADILKVLQPFAAK